MKRSMPYRLETPPSVKVGAASARHRRTHCHLLSLTVNKVAVGGAVPSNRAHANNGINTRSVAVGSDTFVNRTYCRSLSSIVKPNGVTNQLRGLPSACFTPGWAYTALRRVSASLATKPMWETSPE